MLGLSREEYLLRYGPDEARAAILDLKKGGDAVHEPHRTDDRTTEQAGGASSGVGYEPSPQPGREAVWAYAKAMIEDAVDVQVIKGKAKYGTVLQTFNGRNPYNDLLQEKVDDLMYSTQLYLEAGRFVELVGRAVRLLEVASSYDVTGEMDEDVSAFLEEAKQCLKTSGLSTWSEPNRDESS